MTWLWPLLAALVVSSAALVGSCLLLLLRGRARRAAVWLLAYAVGTLLAAAILELVPEAMSYGAVDRAMRLFLAGILGFLLLERLLRWRHLHQAHPTRPHRNGAEHETVAMILWGDALHNFVDGLVLGVSFVVDAELGLAATLAVFAHEVPQEIGDFAILLGSGMSPRRAVSLNLLSASTVVPGALASFLWSSGVGGAIPWLLPLAAGGFVYIALADLVPTLHRRRGTAAALGQMALVVLGVATVWGIGQFHHH